MEGAVLLPLPNISPPQDLAVLVLLAAIYFITLGFGWSIVYRMSANSSTVTFYADPRYHPLISDRANVDGILADFDIAPVKTYVQVIGWEKTPSSHGVYWRAERWQIAFQFGRRGSFSGRGLSDV